MFLVLPFCMEEFNVYFNGTTKKFIVEFKSLPTCLCYFQFNIQQFFFPIGRACKSWLHWDWEQWLS